jgi:nitrite reductase (NADH) large subunit
LTRHVIIGDGGAGVTAAHFIRQADPSAHIEIYSDDPNAAYYRAALTNYLIGELRESQLFAIPPDFYKTHNIQRILSRVTAVDGRNARLTLAGDMEIPYDQLLIAAGARPNPPDFAGAELAGVMTMRTLQDARTMMDLASSGRLQQAVVVGGGLLGLEWVQGLLHHGAKVVYLLRNERIFERALDQTASDLVISRLKARGVDVRVNEEVNEALGGRKGRLRAVRLKNSRDEIECQLVGTAIGIRPNVEFLEGSGIDLAVDPVRGPLGIKVDEYLRTNIPNIYAAGDIIHRTLGLWELARLQGRTAGQNMAGGSGMLRETVHYHATRLYDLDFASVGEAFERPSDQVLIDFSRGSGRVVYKKLIIRDDKLIGAIMLGERKQHVRKYGQAYRKLIMDGTDVSAVSKHLLDPSFDLASWMDSHDVGDQVDVARQIVVRSSVRSIADIRKTRHGLAAGLSDLPQVLDVTSQKDDTDFEEIVLTSTGLPEAPALPAAVPSDPTWGTLQIGERQVALKTSAINIGRDGQTAIPLDDPTVSYIHAQIVLQGSDPYIRDLGSSNGTHVNDELVTVPHLLQDGDVLKLGSSLLIFRAGTASGMTLPRPISPPASEDHVAVDEPLAGFLIIRDGPMTGLSFDLNGSSIMIGRDPANNIVLKDQRASWQHAIFIRDGMHWYVKDLGSSNGTWLNDERLEPHQSHPIRPTNRLQLGDTILEVTAHAG